MQSDSYQEDIYPMTPGTEPALTPDEWLGGINRGTSAGRSHRRAQGAAGFASFLCTSPRPDVPSLPSPPTQLASLVQ